MQVTGVGAHMPTSTATADAPAAQTTQGEVQAPGKQPTTSTADQLLLPTPAQTRLPAYEQLKTSTPVRLQLPAPARVAAFAPRVGVRTRLARIAIRAGDVAGLAALLKSATPPNVPLLWRAWMQYTAEEALPNELGVVETLLAHSTLAGEVKTETIEAAIGGYSGVDVIRRLLEVGCRPAKNGLHVLALRNGPISMTAAVPLLVSYGAEPNPGPDQDAPLRTLLVVVRCPEERRLEGMRALLRAGADANDCRERWNEPPLVAVVRTNLWSADGHVKAIKLLLKYGADIHKYYDNETPLGAAIRARNADGVRALVALGADPRKQRAVLHKPDFGHISVRTLKGDWKLRVVPEPEALDFAALAGSSDCVAALRATGKFTDAERRAALKMAHWGHNRATAEALQRPKWRLNKRGAGRTFLLSRIRDWFTDDYHRVRYGKRREELSQWRRSTYGV